MKCSCSFCEANANRIDSSPSKLSLRNDCRFSACVIYSVLVNYEAFISHEKNHSERCSAVAKQVKPKKQVADHGEVFADKREA